jgi:hypothetical protein
MTRKAGYRFSEKDHAQPKIESAMTIAFQGNEGQRYA